MNCFRSFNEARELQQKNMSFRVFSEEIGPGGQRHFLVSSYEDFWPIYSNRELKKYYEVVLPDLPCKLYFGETSNPLFEISLRCLNLFSDLEFPFKTNVEKNGKEISTAFLGFIIKIWKKEFDEDISLGMSIFLIVPFHQ